MKHEAYVIGIAECVKCKKKSLTICVDCGTCRDCHKLKKQKEKNFGPKLT